MGARVHVTLIYRLVNYCLIYVVLVMIRAMPDDRYLLARYGGGRLWHQRLIIDIHLGGVYVCNIQLFRQHFDHLFTHYDDAFPLLLRCATLWSSLWPLARWQAYHIIFYTILVCVFGFHSYLPDNPTDLRDILGLLVLLHLLHHVLSVLHDYRYVLGSYVWLRLVAHDACSYHWVAPETAFAYLDLTFLYLGACPTHCSSREHVVLVNEGRLAKLRYVFWLQAIGVCLRPMLSVNLLFKHALPHYLLDDRVCGMGLIRAVTTLRLKNRSV